MLKKLIINLSAAGLAAAAVLSFSVTAHATTADDVAEVARSYGYSEEDIQAGYNEYYSHPEDFPSERLDRAIAKLHEQGHQLITTGPQQTTAINFTTTTSASVTTGEGKTSVTTPAGSGVITLTTSDGVQFTRVSKSDFINMSYDEKMAYVAGFTPEQQQVIIDNLSPEEYRSLLKQAPTDTKINVVNSMSEFASEMGLNLSVDEISDDSLTILMKNSDGELVSVHEAGATVEDTGYDRRGLYAAAAALFAAAVGLYLLVRRNLEN